jgi:hypothetical protein
VHEDRVAFENLRLDHPVTITTQFRSLTMAREWRRCPPTCPLLFGVLSQGQPRLLSFAECRLGRSQLST